ncbi:hypothetical protein [Amycolatopsis rubida]|uniref:hypothetical protein n=1 Tax=Amycolatopsis rubida TaxID=112413 RepID=UPI000B8A2A98|nr:hypothetical protein [Amycolatopsis rubida]
MDIIASRLPLSALLPSSETWKPRCHAAWARDKLTKTCQEAIQEATRIRATAGGRSRADWVAWNQALPSLWLFGDDRLVRAAAREGAS